MGSYSYNQAGFLAASNHNLKNAYCNLVAIELALKERLGRIHSNRNGGHNVPSLLQAYAPSSNDTGTINSLAQQLANALNALWSQGKDGVGERVPSYSYPYLRYLRHDTGGWGGNHSSDIEVQHLSNIVSDTRARLKVEGVMK